MTACRCKGDSLCTRCNERQDAEIDARNGRPRGYSQRDLDRAADAAGDRMAGF